MFQVKPQPRIKHNPRHHVLNHLKVEPPTATLSARRNTVLETDLLQYLQVTTRDEQTPQTIKSLTSWRCFPISVPGAPYWHQSSRAQKLVKAKLLIWFLSSTYSSNHSSGEIIGKFRWERTRKPRNKSVPCIQPPLKCTSQYNEHTPSRHE